MAKITYRVGEEDGQVSYENSVFTVEDVSDTDFDKLVVAITATSGSAFASGKYPASNLDNSYQNVLALQATGFEWDRDAARIALSTVCNLLRRVVNKPLADVEDVAEEAFHEAQLEHHEHHENHEKASG